MKKRIGLLVAGILLHAGLGLAAEPVKFGLMAPMTGAWASEGQEMKQIVTLLAEELNSAGGLLGGKVEVLVEDDAGDPRTASLAAQRLATRDIVVAIGTYGSSVTEASQSIYDENSIIQVATGSTAVRLTEKGLQYFFRTCPRDDEQGRVAADTIRKMGHGRVAILHDNTSYAKGLAEETRGLLAKAEGVEIVFFDALTPGERDYNAVLTKMKSVEPQVVLFTGYYPEAGLLLRQKAEMGWKVPFIGGDATNNPDLVKIAGTGAAEGYYFLSPPVPQDLPAEKARTFLAAYESKYGRAPGSIWAVLAGDAFLVAAEAVRQTGSVDPHKLADYLHKDMEAFQGLTGTISFNDKGDRVGEVYRVYRVDADGKFVLQP